MCVEVEKEGVWAMLYCCLG